MNQCCCRQDYTCESCSKSIILNGLNNWVGPAIQPVLRIDNSGWAHINPELIQKINNIDIKLNEILQLLKGNKINERNLEIN